MFVSRTLESNVEKDRADTVFIFIKNLEHLFSGSPKAVFHAVQRKFALEMLGVGRLAELVVHDQNGSHTPFGPNRLGSVNAT